MVNGEHESRTNHPPFYVETEYLDAIVILPIDRFLASIELFPLVNVLSACIASPRVAVRSRRKASRAGLHGERCHETNDLLRVLRTLSSRDKRRVKVGWKVLVQNCQQERQRALSAVYWRPTFALRHGGETSEVAYIMDAFEKFPATSALCCSPHGECPRSQRSPPTGDSTSHGSPAQQNPHKRSPQARLRWLECV